MVHARSIRNQIFLGFLVLLINLILCSSRLHAEWYVAGQIGVNFADPLRNVRGSGALAGLDSPNFNLVTSPAFGGKIGLFPGHGILASNSTSLRVLPTSNISMRCPVFI